MINHESASAFPLMTRQEVADYLNVHSGSVKRYQHQGQLPAILINSRVVRYRREDVDEFVASSRI